MIGKNNIEEKLFDYFEGDLSASDAKELETFVKNNPEYQVDFDAWKQSVVPAVSMQYQHADDLIVEEKSSPKGWLSWASGGALLCLVSLASVGLVSKYDNSDEVVANLEEDLQNEDVVNEIADSKVLNESEVVNDESEMMNAESQDLTILSGVAVNNKNTDNNAAEQLATNKNHLENNKTLSSAVANKAIEGKSVTSTYGNVSDSKGANPLKENKKQSDLSEDLLSSFNINALKEGVYKFVLPFAMRKDKTPYENPNKPKFFITNNKDPYLNYGLAQTLEENASFAGNGGEGIRIEYLYRTERPSATEDNFSSQIISADGFLPKLNAGIGVILNTDRLGHGALNSTAISALYSQKIAIRGVSFEPSLKGTFNSRTISWSQIETNDIKDPRNGILYGSVPFIPENMSKAEVSHFDLGAGLLINAGKFFICGQVDHLNRAEYSNESFDKVVKMPTKISAMAGTDIYKEKGGKFAFSPSINYIKFGNYNALWMNTQFAYQGFFMAAGVATNEELMASLGYKNNLVRLTYGLGFSKPSEFSGLVVTNKYHESHQLSLRVNLHPKR